LKRKICVVTGSRSEYGLLYNIIKQIEAAPKLKLLLVACGTHLSPEFGYTINEIKKDGFKVAERIDTLLSSDSTVGITKSIGLGIVGFADCFKRLKPDILLVLGDRFEIFAAVTAAMAMNFPIVHISGGDITEGVIDEQIRHAITKMSHIHFVSLPAHAHRLRRMGEEPWRIHTVGEPCIDRIKSLKKMPREELEKTLGTSFSHPAILVTFHPVTLQPKETAIQLKNLLSALDKLKAKIIFTYPNADSGGRMIISGIKGFIKLHPNAAAFESVGTYLYLNLISRVDVIVGNSSSALVEAPSFKLPAVNIGERQKGRFKPQNVISASGKAASIKKAIQKALSPQFRKRLAKMTNPYDKGGVAKEIVNVLSGLELGQKILNKKFID